MSMFTGVTVTPTVEVEWRHRHPSVEVKWRHSHTLLSIFTDVTVTPTVEVQWCHSHILLLGFNCVTVTFYCGS